MIVSIILLAGCIVVIIYLINDRLDWLKNELDDNPLYQIYLSTNMIRIVGVSFFTLMLILYMSGVI